MENPKEPVKGVLGRKNIENLLLMAVLGDSSMRQEARQELHLRRIVNRRDDFEDYFMTNLSVV